MEQNELMQSRIDVSLYENITSENVVSVWNAYKSLHKLSFSDPRIERDILILLKVNNLNPFKREAFIVPFKGSHALVIAYQTLLRRAYEAGYDSKQLEFKEEKIISYRYNQYNKLVEVEDIQCTASITSSENKTYSFSILYSEYNKNTSIWKEKPIFMLRKCAVACLCRVLPNAQLSALPYTKEELI